MCVPKGQSGNSGHGLGDGGNKDHWKESDSEDGKKIKIPDLYLSQRNLKKIQLLSKYASLSVDGEDENEGEDYIK